MFEINSRGTEICFAHDAGECKLGARCMRAHQCRKCLNVRCKSGSCQTQTPTRKMQGTQRSKGKGKGGRR